MIHPKNIVINDDNDKEGHSILLGRAWELEKMVGPTRKVQVTG